ncbi:hypothetical protein GCM10027515_09780 [Schumannella luteola]|uniref:Uncharacterized protein n=1 Tax=Schumannella luteola TaxID=472059 RepID=A0A852Y3F0_9MICO|nr:hypothetical protein [Schumannella luteola]NYG97426.1 hypothetical protein [Schumannella luteola]TPX01670.1 hypothetical protein FJ656_26535 [Schumannella luteola]
MSVSEPSPERGDVGKALSQSGFLQFLTSGVGVPKDLAMKVFPELSRLLGRGADVFAKLHGDASKSNAESQAAVAGQEKFVAEVYAEQLRIENLSAEERAALNEKLENTATRMNAKDSENKKFILSLLQLAGTGVVAALAIAVVVLNSDPGASGTESDAS